jgi:hypothetical protein
VAEWAATAAARVAGAATAAARVAEWAATAAARVAEWAAMDDPPDFLALVSQAIGDEEAHSESRR